jgi:hypothetical protein
MPDVWTSNPEKLRRMLQQEHIDGIRCGEEPRVIADRDPTWTCVLEWDSPDGRWLGDIYIHDIRTLFTDFSSPFAQWLPVLLLLTLVIGVVVGRITARR